MAGVPPLMGFFSKLLILILLVNTSLSALYFFFFILLFFGLYFYLQNVRFLYNCGTGRLDYAFIDSVRRAIIYFYVTALILFVFVVSFAFFDDLILYFQ